LADEDLDIKANIEQALYSLGEKSYRDSWKKQKQAQDKQIMQAIYKFKFAKIDTVRLCEDGIKEVDNFRSKLNNSSQFRNEIDQILQLIKDKIANYQRSLQRRDDLDKVDNLTDLERIHTNIPSCILSLTILPNTLLIMNYRSNQL